MAPVTPVVLQNGIPDILTGLVGIGSVIVILLIVVALGGTAYKTYTGGVDWPDEDEEEDDDGVRKGDSDDEWDYY